LDVHVHPPGGATAVRGIHVVNIEEEKGRAAGGKELQTRKVLSLE